MKKVNMLALLVLGCGFSVYAFDMPKAPTIPTTIEVPAVKVPAVPSMPAAPAAGGGNAVGDATDKANAMKAKIKGKIPKMPKASAKKASFKKPEIKAPAVKLHPADAENLDSAKKLLNR